MKKGGQSIAYQNIPYSFFQFADASLYDIWVTFHQGYALQLCCEDVKATKLSDRCH